MCNGGHTYGDPDFPCELGSGAESPDNSYGNVIGGGMIGQYYFYFSIVLEKLAANNSRLNYLFTHPTLSCHIYKFVFHLFSHWLHPLSSFDA